MPIVVMVFAEAFSAPATLAVAVTLMVPPPGMVTGGWKVPLLIQNVETHTHWVITVPG